MCSSKHTLSFFLTVMGAVLAACGDRPEPRQLSRAEVRELELTQRPLAEPPVAPAPKQFVSCQDLDR